MTEEELDKLQAWIMSELEQSSVLSSEERIEALKNINKAIRLWNREHLKRIQSKNVYWLLKE